MDEDKNYIKFFVHMDKIPSGTAQERQYAYNPRLRRVMTYPSKSYKEAKAIYRKALKQFAPVVPYKAPISLKIGLNYPTKDKKKIDNFKTTKPDGDNLLKVIKDVMNELNYFEDDANVAIEEISRWWSTPDKGGIYVEVQEI